MRNVALSDKKSSPGPAPFGDRAGGPTRELIELAPLSEGKIGYDARSAGLMAAVEVERIGKAQTIDAWVAEQLTAFAPLTPADLVTLAAILGYDTAVSPGEAA